MTRKNEFELAVAYEPAEAGWLTATIAGLPGVITAGRTKDEARANVLDALRTTFAAPAGDVVGRDVEIVRLSVERSRQHHRSR
jgi:predicted RNase H-like HicB family nuclease